MQACLAYVNFKRIFNSDIRKIFGLAEKEKAKASRFLTSAFPFAKEEKCSEFKFCLSFTEF